MQPKIRIWDTDSNFTFICASVGWKACHSVRVLHPGWLWTFLRSAAGLKHLIVVGRYDTPGPLADLFDYRNVKGGFIVAEFTHVKSTKSIFQNLKILTEPDYSCVRQNSKSVTLLVKTGENSLLCGCVWGQDWPNSPSFYPPSQEAVLMPPFTVGHIYCSSFLAWPVVQPWWPSRTLPSLHLLFLRSIPCIQRHRSG